MTTKKSSMKMRGFMCQSTAVCRVSDPRSAIVPRTPERILQKLLDTSSSSSTVLSKKSTINYAFKYSRLVEAPIKLLPPAPNRSVVVSSINKLNENRPKHVLLQKPGPSASSDRAFQVVVLRVSLHCQGCAGKVKKHLSKMEGVTSFSIDIETNRVTVMGNISPVAVLESISKLKPAEFWPVPAH